MKWDKVRVEEFANVIGGGTPSTSNASLWDGDVPWITPKDLSGYQLRYISRGERNITEEGLRRSSARLVPEKTVLLTTRAPVGYVAIAQNPLCTNQGFKNLICDPEKAHYEFIYYLLKHNRELLESQATGSTYKELSAGRLRKIELRIPGTPVQRRIASILSAYDDLIENNLRRIKLLEESARLLYKEWFVRLRFPGHEHTRIINGVPEGWERKAVRDLAEIQSGFAFKSSSYVSQGRYGIVTIKNVKDGEFDPNCVSFLGEPPEKIRKHCYLQTGDILLSLTGNIGRACIVVGDDYLLNQRVAKLAPKETVFRSYVYFMFREELMRKKLEAMSYGVAQQNLSPVKMGEMEIMVSNKTLLHQFFDFAEPIINQMVSLRSSNSKLRQARDLLLPKLMSGEIELDNLGTKRLV